MRRVSLAISIYLVLLSLTTLSAEELKWESTLSEAFTKSKLQNKPLMVFIEQKHCRWCKKMESETLSDSSITKRLEGFVLVKLDKHNLDSDDIPYPKFAPTVYLFSSKKELLIRVGGYYVVQDFNSYLDDFQKKLK